MLLKVSMTGDPMTAADRVQPVLDAVAATRAAHPGVQIDQFGDGSANKWFEGPVRMGTDEELERLEAEQEKRFSLPADTAYTT